jgi:hypothetical protein
MPVVSPKRDVRVDEVSFDELLATRVDDGVLCADASGFYYSYDYELRAVGLVKGRLIAGKKTGTLSERGGIEFDEDGCPYYELEYCGQKLRDYDPDFLGNWSWAASMGKVHQSLIRSIQTRALQNEQIRPHWEDFRSEKRVADAKQRLKLAEYAGKEPEYEDEILVEAAERKHQRVNAEAFDFFYVQYMKSKGYEKKVREYLNQFERIDWKQHLEFEISTLERNGFRQISPRSMEKHIRRLRDRAAQLRESVSGSDKEEA